jgi:ubiquinone/menaquinone biosynthesis C-methylase UbiE
VKTFETSVHLIDLSNMMPLVGRVLDVGGGGEGIVSRCICDSIVCIDKSANELSKTLDLGTKIIMDACDLKFIDNYFDHVTCFFTLMYMNLQQIEKFFREAHRVLKENALLYIWDAIIPPMKCVDVFVIQLEVILPGKDTVSVGYGASYKEQSMGTFINLCESSGFEMVKSSVNDNWFLLILRRK